MSCRDNGVRVEGLITLPCCTRRSRQATSSANYCEVIMHGQQACVWQSTMHHLRFRHWSNVAPLNLRLVLSGLG